MRWLGAVVLLLGGLLNGCGTYIILTVDSDYAVPDEVDVLDLRVTDPDTRDQLGHFEITLEPGESFPVELLVEPTADSPSPLRMRILARLCDGECGDDAVSVARGEALVTWQAEAVNEAEFPELVELP